MANIFTAVEPTAFSAARVVQRERTAAFAALNLQFDDKGVAIGDTVKVPIAPVRSSSNYTPAMTTSAGDDATATSVDVSITASKETTWNLTGEQALSLENGTINQEWLSQLLQQGMRTLRNDIEADAVSALMAGASRAVGTAGTTPFASDINLIVDAQEMLRENGAPGTDLHIIYNLAAGSNLAKLKIIQEANQAGSDAERRSGEVGRQYGFELSSSAQITTHTKGTGSGYQVNNASGYSIGDTAITVDTGSGTILAGDVITFAGDSNQYVVASALASNVVTIAAPGLRQALADNTALTVAASYTANFAFERNSTVGIIRPPAMPENQLHSKMLISDEAGLTYMLVDIPGDGMRTWALRLAWGFKTVNPEYCGLILG